MGTVEFNLWGPNELIPRLWTLRSGTDPIPTNTMQTIQAEKSSQPNRSGPSYPIQANHRAEIARQEARLKIEKENLVKEKSFLMGTASNRDNQDGELEITVSGEKYRCLRFVKAKK
ncbi:hypothetical protein DVH24_010170 [Malus domestica]|uniref:Uncharacterized protein n=1 Tax=Malus domestica TaxID=3750 RepID=A0A498JRP0_MALDO|nr:hypothetical protein DVH24_010170 [Malus domestica]